MAYDPFEPQKQEWFSYLPPLTREADFESFWAQTLEESRRRPLEATRTRYDFPMRGLEVYDITYRAADGTLIHGWYLLPDLPRPLPCLVHYHGLGGNRARPADLVAWTMMGLAVVSVDCRDQGGQTGSAAEWTNGTNGTLYLRGIGDPWEYYLRDLYTDAVRAIDFAVGQGDVDAGFIVAEGGSQGGGLSMAVSALDSRVKLTLADVPSYSDLHTRVMGGHGGFSAVADYLKRRPEDLDRCFRTLTYFDTMNLADRIGSKVLASVGGRDPVCPPKCFFATYNRITSAKQVEIYPFNGHEGGGTLHHERKLRFLRQALDERQR